MAPAEPHAALINVLVCYSPAPRQIEQVRLTLPACSTVRDAVQASGLLARLAEQALDVGLWGRRVGPDVMLHADDRVELYRALTVDPKEARRLRYRTQKPPRRKLIGPAA
jgi:putative ubiquitin-RnfH superfamily antitoxin RatB of RatAB toxin-antitoxin module